MLTITFNPYPPRPPVPLPLGATTTSTALPPGDLHWRFYKHYNRGGGRRTDSVQLTGADLASLQNDGDTAAQVKLIEQRMIRRAKHVLEQLPCDETAEFTDGGYELMPTTPYSTLSWAIGRYSLYWKATGRVGPRVCDITDTNCPGGKRSDGVYTITIEWTAYDVFDFDWRLFFQPWMWLGSPFHVFGIWQTTTQGTVSTCNTAPPGPPPCQDDITLNTFYEVLAAVYQAGSTKPVINREGVIDSAMGRLMLDGKEWCSTGGCSDQENICIPRFKDVTAKIVGEREESLDELVRVYVRVTVSAKILCRCGRSYEADFPNPR